MGLPGDSYWVEQGRFLAGPYPGDPDPDRERAKLRAFLELGIRRFVDLTEPGEHSTYAPTLREVAAELDAEATHLRLAPGPRRRRRSSAGSSSPGVRGAADSVLNERSFKR